MSKEKIYIFDTTLRDGAQTEGVNFSLDDKNKIAKTLFKNKKNGNDFRIKPTFKNSKKFSKINYQKYY